MRPMLRSAFLPFALATLVSCGGGGGGSPTETPPPPPPPPITANSVVIKSISPVPGQSLRVGLPIRATFDYEAVGISQADCYLAKNGERVSGGSGIVTGANERGTVTSTMSLSENNYDFLGPEKKTDSLVCELRMPRTIEILKSASMEAVYFWHL